MASVRRRVAVGGLVLVLFVLALGAMVYLRPLWFADQKMRYDFWRAGVRSEYAEVDGNRIHYFEAASQGGGGDRPLVLIHGLGARGEYWLPMIPGLAAAGFHVYVPDLLGYGRSPRPDVSYSIAMEADLVRDFMRAMHVDRADVAGWSMGGWVAMKLATDDAAMVNRLVLFDAAGTYFPGSSELGQVFDAKDADGVRRLMGMLTPNPQRMPDFIARDLARRIQENVWVTKRSLASMMSGRDLMDFQLHRVRQPTLVVWGKQDVLIPLSAGESIHRGIEGSSMLVVDGCGHLTPAECSRVSLEATLAFLNAQPAMVGGERVVSGKQ